MKCRMKLLRKLFSISVTSFSQILNQDLDGTWKIGGRKFSGIKFQKPRVLLDWNLAKGKACWGGHWDVSNTSLPQAKIGQCRNTMSKIDEIPTPHFDPFVRLTFFIACSFISRKSASYVPVYFDYFGSSTVTSNQNGQNGFLANLWIPMSDLSSANSHIFYPACDDHLSNFIGIPTVQILPSSCHG